MYGSRHRHDPPIGWSLLCEDFLEAPPSVSRWLWLAFARQCSLTERYVLEHALDDGAGVAPTRIFETITPSRLLALTLAVSPEDGRPRDPTIVDLEETIVRRMRPLARRAPWYA